MKRVAVFGNAGGGKSTLAYELATITGLPLHVLDKIQFRVGGSEVPYEEYLQVHSSLIESDEWIVDRFGCSRTVWERLEAADTLIHIDLPLPVHFLWVIKRLVKGFIGPPKGWPIGSPLIRSSISSCRVLLPCHRRLTPQYRAYVVEAACRKKVYRLRSKRDIKRFITQIAEEVRLAEYILSPEGGSLILPLEEDSPKRSGEHGQRH